MGDQADGLRLLMKEINKPTMLRVVRIRRKRLELLPLPVARAG